MEKQILKLKNVFTGDYVLCEDMETIRTIDGVPFIQVFKDEKKDRTFFVKRSAFEIVNK